MSAPLRVALIASNRFPLCQPFAGGLEAHVWHLARALVERGHEVSLFAGSGSDLSLDCAALTVRELTLSAAAQADPSASPAAFMADHHAYLNLMVQLADPRSGFDIVHNHSLHHLPVAMAPMLGTPMLTTLHTPPTPWLESALDVTGSAGTRFAAVSRHTAARVATRRTRRNSGAQRRGLSAMAAGAWRRQPGVVRTHHRRKGAAHGDRSRSAGRPAPGPGRTHQRHRVLQACHRTIARRPRPLCRAPQPR